MNVVSSNYRRVFNLNKIYSQKIMRLQEKPFHSNLRVSSSHFLQYFLNGKKKRKMSKYKFYGYFHKGDLINFGRLPAHIPF